MEIINISDVPYLPRWLTITADGSLETIDYDDFDKVWGYIVSIEHDDSSVFLFKKCTPQKLLDKGKLAMSFNSDLFEKMGTSIVTIGDDYDAATLTRDSDNGNEETKIYIFNRSNFES